ncbi:MAG: Do family serine endopeptidase [Burkholderiales bacterium]|nr:Do family serine endopeptidase [Burkholderiales bacterium]
MNPSLAALRRLGALAAIVSLFVVDAAAAPPAAAPVPLVGVPDFTQITQRYGAAVVNISVSGTRKVTAGDDGGNADADSGGEGDGDAPEADPMQQFLRRFQQQFGGTGATMQVPVRALGSGFIVGADGLILTNAHVVADASEVIVKLTDRREFRARILGTDAKTDIAVLRIDAKGLPVVAIGNPAELRVGEWVLAIGSPFGFENSVSAGVVSAKGRSLPDDSAVSFIQTDAAVNPGNSGGPLFNARGEVVGINAQIYSRSGGFQGLSFAIPIDLALRVQQQIVATGHASHGLLGVAIQEVDQGLADAFRLPAPRGALISDVEPGSAGAAAGLRAGDVVLAIDGAPINVAGDLPATVTMGNPGQHLTLEVWRDGQTQRVPVTLDDAAQPSRAPAPARAVANIAALGIGLRALPPGERRSAGGAAGLRVESVAGPAQAAGVLVGDLLLAIGGRPVAGIEQVRAALAQAAAAAPSVALLLLRGNDRVYLAVRTK